MLKALPAIGQAFVGTADSVARFVVMTVIARVVPAAIGASMDPFEAFMTDWSFSPLLQGRVCLINRLLYQRDIVWQSRGKY